MKRHSLILAMRHFRQDWRRAELRILALSNKRRICWQRICACLLLKAYQRFL